MVLNCTGSTRRFLRWKLSDGRCISSFEVTKRPLCNIHQNRWRITRGMQLESRMLHLESRSYNKSYSSPKAYCFLRIVDKKPSLVVLSHCLTPLNSACISFTLNQVHSLVRICHRAIPWRFRNLLHFYSISARVSLISSEYPTWRRSTLMPCGHDINRVLIYLSVLMS
jgi:hypothetical protein